MDENTLITERLIECRERMGLSKNKAAKSIGVSQPAYLRYESGERTPSIQVVKEIAKIFQTSSDYLFGKTDSPDTDTYVVTKEENPELFLLLERYYHAEKNQQKRILAYIKELL